MGVSRRHFFYGSLLAGAVPTGGFGTFPSLKAMGYKSPNEKLNIAGIGAGGQGAGNLMAVSSENIVALADPDAKRAGQTFERFEKAAKYTDFRKMLDKESSIDAVIVATPDHMHGICSMWAMERGKHVYCQKPLTRTIWEARQLTEAAAKFKVATQMGNQGYSNEGTRQCCEMIWRGDIGDVTEVHAWTNRPIWPQGISEIPPEEPVPPTLDWDAWIGIAQMRPYTSGGAAYEKNQWGKFYQPFNWRGFYDFGCGALGDMACHVLGAPNMALRLGAPSSVECLSQEGKNSLTFPTKSTIRFDFPARGTMPPVTIYWYDGLKNNPKRPNGLAETEYLGDLPRAPFRQGGAGGGQGGQRAGGPGGPPRPRYGQPIGEIYDHEQFAATLQRIKDAGGEVPYASQSGVVFVGTKGMMTAGEYGAGARLLPNEKMADYRFPPQLLTRSPGHFQDWLRACKGGDPACSNFSLAGPFTEWILLGVLALRVDGKLEWDSAKMRVTNNNDANKLIKPYIRKGWSWT